MLKSVGEMEVNAIFQNISEQLRMMHEFQRDVFAKLGQRLCSVEKELKDVRNLIESKAHEVSSKGERFTMFSNETKSPLSLDDAILRDNENKKTTSQSVIEDGFLFPQTTKSNRELEEFGDYIDRISYQKNDREVYSPTSSSTFKSNPINCRLYVKSSDETKPAEIGHVMCSLTTISGGKILEIMKDSYITKSKIRLTNRGIEEVLRKDGKKYVAIIFPDTSFDYIEGDRLGEFYLKFTDKDIGFTFYEEIKGTGVK